MRAQSIVPKKQPREASTCLVLFLACPIFVTMLVALVWYVHMEYWEWCLGCFLGILKLILCTWGLILDTYRYLRNLQDCVFETWRWIRPTSCILEIGTNLLGMDFRIPESTFRRFLAGGGWSPSLGDWSLHYLSMRLESIYLQVDKVHLWMARVHFQVVQSAYWACILVAKHLDIFLNIVAISREPIGQSRQNFVDITLLSAVNVC